MTASVSLFWLGAQGKISQRSLLAWARFVRRALSRFAVVVLQQSAELLFAAHFGKGDRGRRGHQFCSGLCRFRWRRTQKQIVLALVRTATVIKCRKRFCQVIQVLLAKENEVIENLAAKCLMKPLDKRLQVRRSDGRVQAG